MNKDHKHFKFTENSLSHVFEDHRKIAVWLGVFLILILCAVILLFVDSKNNIIKFTKDGDNKTKNVLAIKQNYEKETKKVLGDYIQVRNSEEMLEQEKCQEEINSTFEKILNLIVPAEYKELHLKTVVLLDKESSNCNSYEKIKEELSSDWKELFNNYSWLK